MDAWEPQWNRVVAEAPPPEAAVDLDRAGCDRLLVAARAAEPELLPSPDEALDGPVQKWLDDAETIGFECRDHPDLEHGLTELDIIEAEIAAGLRALQ